MKKIFFIILLALVTIISCKKENINMLDGKLKNFTMTTNTADTNIVHTYYLNYNNNGYLNKIIYNNKPFIIIEEPVSNKIRMRINQNIDSNSTNEVYTDLYFYLNGNYFNSVTRLNAFTGLEDTIASYETENSYIKDISHEYLLGYYYTYFNFEFNNGNIIKFKNGYTNFFGWQYVDSIMVSYNSYLTQNISKAPFQYIGYSYTYYSLPPVHLIDILFLLGINNYYPYQPNRNLIANINNISQYTYSINNNLLNDMNIINNITNFNQDIHFEYY